MTLILKGGKRLWTYLQWLIFEDSVVQDYMIFFFFSMNFWSLILNPQFRLLAQQSDLEEEAFRKDYSYQYFFLFPQCLRLYPSHKTMQQVILCKVAVPLSIL